MMNEDEKRKLFVVVGRRCYRCGCGLFGDEDAKLYKNLALLLLLSIRSRVYVNHIVH